MTKDEIEAIKARAAAATPGPWYLGDDSYYPGWLFDEGGGLVCGGFSAPNTDGMFIAHARQDIDTLVAEVERLRSVFLDLTEGGCVYRDDCPIESGHSQCVACIAREALERK